MTATGDTHAALYHTANAARYFLEENIWPRWQEQTSRQFNIPLPQILSAGTCGRSSTFLVKVFAGCGVDARIEHGWFRAAGLTDGASVAPRHAWVMAGGWIIDITADQFGGSPVVVTEVGNSRYENGLDTADEDAVTRRRKVADQLWDRWLQSNWRSGLTGAMARFSPCRHG